MNYSAYNTWIELSEIAYRNNIDFFKKRSGKNTEISVVLKSNAYGHGILKMAELARRAGIKTVCVHSFEEAITLCEGDFSFRIILLGPVPFMRLSEVVAADNIEPVCYNRENLLELRRHALKMKKNVRIHLKVETGTNRQGIEGKELKTFLSELAAGEGVELVSVYTHFANIEDTTTHDYAEYQIERYEKAVDLVKKAGFSGFKRHLACSAAAAIFDKTHRDMIRLGISQYGLWSSKETYLSYISEHGHPEKGHILEPVMTWKTRISQIKKIPPNSYIGYGCTYQTTRETIVAVLPVGYSDGYDRLLSNSSYVLIHGKRAPVRGRIMMNLMVVDVTDIPEASLEDEVVLLGKWGKQSVSADTLADFAGTINYEIVTRIAPHIPRFIV
ncbi:MAG: alanine racemase [bacterium]